jgi:translocation and assembly module TamA
MLAMAGASPSTSAQSAPSAAADEQALPNADAAIRYRVRVVAPDAVASVVTSSVDLVRWQDFADMTEQLLDRLIRESVSQASEAAATQGFYSAKVEIAIDRTASPAAVTLTVLVGEPTLVTGVDIVVTGPVTSDPLPGVDIVARVRDEWALRVGEIFRQSAWTAAKDRAVATLAASPYAGAQIVSSEARVDPEARAAQLSLELASGPAFRFGAVEVRGLQKYSEGLVRNFATITAGELYSLRLLDDYVRRLLASGYFASVQASLDTDPEHAAAAPVTLNVIEAPTKRLELGVGYSTDTQWKASGNYSDVNIDGHGLQFYADVRLESKLTSGNVRLVLPPTAARWLDSFGAGVDRTDIENLVTRTAAVTVRRRTIDERNTLAFGAGLFYNQQQAAGFEAEDSHALYVDGEYTWRRVDNLLAPQRGYMVNLQAGAGIPGASTRTFGRLIGRFAAWLPLSHDNELSARADAGAVLADSRNGIPSNFLFRTGGDTTVRGYAFESLGVQQGSAVVGGRYYAVASGEATHWFNDSWGVATFIDAGNATDSLQNFHFALGYGAGARLRTPIGPFRVDVAYGQDVKSVRVHFSVGLSF